MARAETACEQRLAVGEVPVGRVVRDADAAGHLAKHDGVGPVGGGELDAGVDERLAQVAVVVGHRGFADSC